ncbi:uncharacterized protein TNCT_346151 [Trichonephila clavata]|uniref:Uncharacterized protein n=1 Tax=Trichonephila clavata TaxID=2740835 RepID=A0A8X6K983_TRICU|nr:uncharacterized protein TNCT_346151 [Trichonephila clavata]
MDEIVNLGPWLPCSWCRALKWKDETQGMCCSGGKVQLPNLEPYPGPLYSLLTHQDPLSEHFLSTIHIVISMSGKALLQFGFLSPSREAGFAISNHHYGKELGYDTVHPSKIVAENVPKLNQEQKEIYDK